MTTHSIYNYTTSSFSENSDSNASVKKTKKGPIDSPPKSLYVIESHFCKEISISNINIQKNFNIAVCYLTTLHFSTSTMRRIVK